MPARHLVLILPLALACARAAHASYDFSYRIAGDRTAAPVQVFDDGRQTYLQFRNGQTAPAIFVLTPQGERLAGVSWQGGYAVLAGTGQTLLLRLADSRAQVDYQGRASSMPAARPAPPRPVFDAVPADRTMRQTLKRWAGLAGWTFEPEHWTVDVDIPLAGSAALGSEFKPAVRELLASTELSAHPLQPCFYSNRVLRVIPLAESCSRGALPAAGRS